jgi:repressor LexA
MVAKLTARQAEILEFLKDYYTEYQICPTQSEMAQAFSVNVTAIKDHLKALDKKGYIELNPGKARSIKVLGQNEDELPLIGSVAAGSPIEAIENVERMVPVPRSLFRSGPTYLLRVRGESMRDVGILDGDMIAVKRTTEARNGQIIVARIGDEVTVKRLERDGSRFALMPENNEFEPIYVAPNELVIEGLFVGLIRDCA